MDTLNPFLDRYDTIIFDMDGVITSEQNYWDIASLTVFELLNDKNYYGTEDINPAWCQEHVKEIREELFCSDKLIMLFKERGVNSNWDLAYLTFSFLLSRYASTSEELLEKLYETEDAYAFELYDMASDALIGELGLDRAEAERSGMLWQMCQNVFQEWYLGEEEFLLQYGYSPKVSGKKPMYARETPIIPKEDLHRVLSLLSKSGKRLGIGTGRPKFEIEQPLKLWDIYKYFDKNSCVNYTDIMESEEALRKKGIDIALTKPHPYIFLKALYGRNFSDEMILNKQYDLSPISRTLIVGDAGSDILAAKAMGAPFAAVLTGVAGKAARSYFEEQGSEHILNDIREFLV